MNPKRINKQKGKGATYKRKLLDLYAQSKPQLTLQPWTNALHAMVTHLVESVKQLKAEQLKLADNSSSIYSHYEADERGLTEQINPISNGVDDAWINVLNNRRDIKSEYAKYNPKHNDINPILTRTEQDITGGPLED